MGIKKNTVGMEATEFQEGAKFNLSGLYQALRLTVANGNNTLWVPFDDGGMRCCMKADPTQRMYIEAIYCLLIKIEDLNEGFRIDASTASRIAKNSSGHPKYISDYLYKENIFCVFLERFKQDKPQHTAGNDFPRAYRKHKKWYALLRAVGESKDKRHD